MMDCMTKLSTGMAQLEGKPVDFSKIPTERLATGEYVPGDGAWVEGQQWKLTQFKDKAGENWFEFSGKVRGKGLAEMEAGVKQMGGVKKEIGRGAIKWARPEYADSPIGKGIEAKVMREGKLASRMSLVTDKENFAFKGLTRIAVKAKNREEFRRLFWEEYKPIANLTEKMFAVPTVIESEKLKLMRLLWQMAPQEADKLVPLIEKLTVGEIKDVVAKQGLTRHVNKMVRKEVFPGYKTWVVEGIEDEYRKAGGRYLFHTVDSGDVAKIIKGDGLMSGTERYRRWKEIRGASIGSDIESGGADSVFLRLVGKKHIGGDAARITISRDSYLIYDLKLLERTDWYAYASDHYGLSNPAWAKREGFPGTWTGRSGSRDFVKAVSDDATGFRRNEVMLRTGVGNKYLKRIWVKDGKAKKTVLNRLRGAGLEQVNGVPIDDFVVASKTVPDL